MSARAASASDRDDGERRGKRGRVGERADGQRREQDGAELGQHRAAAGELRAVRGEATRHREAEREEVAEAEADHGQPEQA